MKVYVSNIEVNDGFAQSPFSTVSVVFHDDKESPHKSANVTVYIDKSITDIEQIKKAAIQAARDFLDSITRKS